MKFENFITEYKSSLNSLESTLVETDDVEALEKKIKLLAAMSVLIGAIFDDEPMLQNGIEVLQDFEVPG